MPTLLPDGRPCVARLVQPAATGVAFLGRNWQAVPLRGWVSAGTSEVMSDGWTTDLVLPNAMGPDGVLHRDRFAITRDRMAPVQGASTLRYVGSTYRPGDEWIEIHDGSPAGEPGFVGTPLNCTITRSTITLHLVDGLELLKHSLENAAGYYRHAPRDIIEDCSRVWQVLHSSDFDEAWGSIVWDGTGATHTTPDGKWQYSRAETDDQVAVAERIPDTIRLRCTTAGTQAIWQPTTQFAAGLNATNLEDRFAPWRFECMVTLPAMQTPVVGGAPASGLYVGITDQYSGENWASIVHWSDGSFQCFALHHGTTEGVDTVRTATPGQGTLGARPGPYHYVVEGRGEFVYCYINAQLVGVMRMPPDTRDNPPASGQYDHLSPTVVLNMGVGTEAATATLHNFLFRKGVQLLGRAALTNSSYRGDLHLPGLPTPGALVGTYWNDTGLLPEQRLGPLNEEYARREENGIDYAIEPTDQLTQINTAYGSSGGTHFTLTVNGETTGPVIWNDSLANLTAALVALAGVAPGDVVLTGAPAAYQVQWTGALSGQDVDVTITKEWVGGTATVTTARAANPGWWWPPEGGPSVDASGNIPLSVRWTGSVYLDLDVNDRYLHLTTNGTSVRTRVYVGKTRTGEEYMAAPVGVVAGTSLRTHLYGSTAPATPGWYPIVIEALFSTAPVECHLWWSTDGVDGHKALLPATNMATQGIWLQQERYTSRYETIQSVVETYGHQYVVKPEQLESGRFPGSLVPRVRVGTDTDRTLESPEAVQPQLDVKADNLADALFADAQGLADNKQLTVEVFNWDELQAHGMLWQAYEQLGDIAVDAVARARLQTLLKLHSTLWEEIGVSPANTGSEERAKPWPITGAALRFRWGVGDGVRVWITELGIEDVVPRQILTVQRSRTPDGLRALQIGWQQRVRDLSMLLRKWRRQQIVLARSDRGDRVSATGNPATNSVGAGSGPETVSVVPLPPKRWKLAEVWLVVYDKDDDSTWYVEVNGVVTGQEVRVSDTYKVTAQINSDALKGEPVLAVRLVPGGTGTGHASYIVTGDRRY